MSFADRVSGGGGGDGIDGRCACIYTNNMQYIYKQLKRWLAGKQVGVRHMRYLVPDFTFSNSGLATVFSNLHWLFRNVAS